MTKLDESTIIKIFQMKFNNTKFVSEDVEIINVGKMKIIVKIDTLVQSTDITPKMSLCNAARKSIVACVSDFAAKGVKPRYGLISINLPKSISLYNIKEMSKGFKQASEEFNITILGGDTNQGEEISISVCMLGLADKIVERKGAKSGDVIFVTGPFGYTAAGLAILLGKKKGNQILRKKTLKSLFHPNPKLKFGVKNRNYFTSSMDSSDGLSTTLIEMAKQSKRRFIIKKIPTENDIIEFAKSQNIVVDDLVFNGGEEYEIVFTVSKNDISSIKKSASLLKIPIIEIGYVENGQGVFLEKNKELVNLIDKGWRHFKK